MEEQKFKVIREIKDDDIGARFSFGETYTLTSTGLRDNASWIWTDFLSYNGNNLFQKWINYCKSNYIDPTIFELIKENQKITLNLGDLSEGGIIQIYGKSGVKSIRAVVKDGLLYNSSTGKRIDSILAQLIYGDCIYKVINGEYLATEQEIEDLKKEMQRISDRISLLEKKL